MLRKLLSFYSCKGQHERAWLRLLVPVLFAPENRKKKLQLRIRTWKRNGYSMISSYVLSWYHWIPWNTGDARALRHLISARLYDSNAITYASQCSVLYVWNKLPKLLQQFCNVFLSWRIVAVNSYENTTLSVSLGHYHLCAQDVSSLNLFNSMLQTPFSRCHPSLIHVISDVSGDQLLAKLHNPSAAGNRWCHYCPGSETLSSWLTP